MPSTAKRARLKRRLAGLLALALGLLLTEVLKNQQHSDTWPPLAECAEQRLRANLSSLTGTGKLANEPRLLKISASSLQAAARRSQTRKQVSDLEAAERTGASAGGSLQISITPRLSLIRVPVESNAMLKCLISAQTNKFTKKFDIHWSRYMHDENVYEQIESFTQTPQPADQQTEVPPAEPSRPVNRQQQLRDFLTRTRQETNVISELLVEASLYINPVRSSDNASYFCTATDGISEQSQARIDLVALSKPVVQLERVQPARDSKSAIVYWLILSDGNDPIKKTILMVRNESLASSQLQQARPAPKRPVLDLRPPAQQQDYLEQQQQQQQFATVVINSEQTQWQRVDIPQDGDLPTESAIDLYSAHSSSQANQDSQVVRADVDVTSTSLGSPSDYPFDGRRSRWQLDRRHRSFNLTNLLPGVTYNFRLAAVNDLGQSEWSQLRATMPNEIPAQISEMFLLSRAKDSLAIGWRRPSFDNAKTIRYEMQLFDLNRTLALDAYTNTNGSTPLRTNFMYYFVNLNPGTDYHFHVRACSRAGCSAFSSPKLLASTLDGEPDEPADVELTCSSERLVVSWLPPANPRGQLVNYTVSLEAQATYLNQSNQWTVDEESSHLETRDNHTLTLETSQPPLPNTNYSVRVCANSRPKNCGRLSQKSSRSQCTTPAELPTEMPADVKLVSKPLAKTADSDGSGRAQVESLVLELPPISRRNGSIDCIQLVLIRLPSSFAGGGSFASLASYLPSEPRDVRLASFASLHQERRDNDDATAQQVPEQAVAYLAEEIDPASNPQLSLPQEVVLGDGSQQICSSIAAKIGTTANSSEASPLETRVFDGALATHTYYTGFLKLILVRPAPTSQRSKRANQDGLLQQQVGGVEILTKFSRYFEPVRTAELVPEVALPSEDGSHRSLLSFGSDKPLRIPEIVERLSSSLKSSFGRLYNSSSRFVNENAKLEVVGNYIARSPPFVQLFQIGIIVIGLALLVLLLIYIITLPASMRRRRKRRKQQRQKVYHQNSARQATDTHPDIEGKSLKACEAAEQVNLVESHAQQQKQQQQLVEAYEPLHQQQVAYQQPNEDIPPTYARANQDCPIHSSPRGPGAMEAAGAQASKPRGSVHICQPMMAATKQLPQQVAYGELQHAHHSHAHHHHSHHHHNPHEVGYGYVGQEPQLTQEQYERNCRTMRRPSHPEVARLDCNGTAKVNMTLSHQNSVLALAKKITKSIPLALFGAVFECRVRNGWLREEYEQLPRQVFPALAQQQVAAGGNALQLKLRPQLVVSRGESVSALISGNDHYEASLIRLNVANSGAAEKRIICAKSPLDADSVWDFWRLIYEQEVATIVMLTQSEDPNTGEVRCAQYWPTCDNEETTILSPCNEFVQKSSILPAKFKIRQETLEEESRAEDFRVRRLTLIVMATRAHENEQVDELQQGQVTEDRKSAASAGSNQEEQEELVIVERNILQLQFYHWNTSSLANRLRLIKFVELANERHLRHQLAAETGGPMLVHCYNGLGRSGLFAAMSFVVDDLSVKLAAEQQVSEQQLRKVNLFQLVMRLRSQREMLLSPYRLYELLYQLTLNCIPSQEQMQQLLASYLSMPPVLPTSCHQVVMSHSNNYTTMAVKRPGETACYHQEAIVVAGGASELHQQNGNSSRSQVAADHKSCYRNHHQQYHHHQEQRQQELTTTSNDPPPIARSQGETITLAGDELDSDDNDDGEEGDEEEEEDPVEDDIKFDHKQVLTKILNEKKLALANSPGVIRFLSSNFQQRTTQANMIDIELND